ncbi:hypothetical protein E2O24_07680 [Campylobacter volucris]|nr:hypothetical protein E2O24_07680 [Campylobacter volucris]
MNENKEKIKHLIHFIVFELKDKKIADITINKCIKKNSSKDASIDNLIEELDNLFNRKPTKTRFIFALRGIKGNKNIKINNFEIYNPNIKTLIKDDKKREFFNLSTNQKYMQQELCNIVIELDVVDPEFAKYEAVIKTNILLSLLTYRDLEINVPLYIETGTFYAINSEGKVIGGSLSINDNLLNYYDSKNTKLIQLNKEEILYFEKLIYNKNLNVVDIKLLKSLNSKKRALEATYNHEAILWHWISIENLFDIENSSAKIIFDNAPYILTYNFLYHFLRYEIYYLKLLNFPFSDDCRVPEKVQKLIDTFKGKTYGEIIEIIKEIPELLDKNTFLYEKIDNLISIFTTKEKLLKFAEEFFEDIKQKIIILYKLRNKIVHEAHYEQNSIVQLYKNYAVTINTILLCFFVEQKLQGKTDLVEIINFAKYEYEKLCHKIKNNGISEFFNTDS